MSQIGRITIRKLSELQDNFTNSTANETKVLNKNKQKNNVKRQNMQNAKNLQCTPMGRIAPNSVSVKKKRCNLRKKEPPVNQTRIEAYFKVCPKSPQVSGQLKNCYIKRGGCKRLFTEDDESKCKANENMIHLSTECIMISSESDEEIEKRNNMIRVQNKKNKTDKPCSTAKVKIKEKTKTKKATSPALTGTKARRKLVDDLSPTSTSPSPSPSTSIKSTFKRTSQETLKSKNSVKEATVIETMYETITESKSSKKLDGNESVNESENGAIVSTKISSDCKEFLEETICDDDDLNNNNKTVKNSNRENDENNPVKCPFQVSHSNSAFENEQHNVTSSILSTIDLILEATSKAPSTISATPQPYTKRKIKPCPPYKIIEGTTFAVDAFQFGYLEGVTHYFLTHFHADHYIGLTRKFSYPIYMSELTGRLVQLFIKLDTAYIRILSLNEEVRIDDTAITVTALDANHCPGAVMLLFKHLDTGKCILHTGDFRATYEMEMLPSLWNHEIHTLYLDTTYIEERHPFCTQDDSVEKAKQIIHDFQQRNQTKSILYVCGSYVIGKEKFWSALAEEFNWKVWTEENRYKALKALNNSKWNDLLVANANEAQLHVIAMAKLSYLNLIKYFSFFESNYDMVLAIRPSGWEKSTRPKSNGKINIIGIEYSEHSNLHEMERFVRFLKPRQVISTVPVSRDLFKTSQIPKQWYEYTQSRPKREQQNRITNYMTLKKLNTTNGARHFSCDLNEVTVSPMFPNIPKAKANFLRCKQKENATDDKDDDIEVEEEEKEIQIEYVKNCIKKVKHWLNHRPGDTYNTAVNKVAESVKSDTMEMDADLEKAQHNENDKILLKRAHNRNRILDSDTTTVMHEININESRTLKKVTSNHSVNKKKSDDAFNSNLNLLKTNGSPRLFQENRYTHLDVPSPTNKKLKLFSYNDSKKGTINELSCRMEDQLFKTNNVNVSIDKDADDDWL